MNAPQPNAAAREPSRVARASAEDLAVEESLAAHANRVLRSRLTAAVVCVLDPGIALLQWLRKAAGGAQHTEAGEDDLRSRKDRPGGRPDAAAAPVAETATPKPRRRLRAFLIYLSVLLAGGMGGGALAYELLEKLIIYGYSENGRLEAALSTQSKSADSARQELEQAKAARSEAEKKLAALRAGNAQAPPPAARESTGRAVAATTPAPKTVDCSAIASDNIAALMDCIHKFNR